MATSKEGDTAKPRTKALLKAYAKLHKKLGRSPTANELSDAGFTRDAVKNATGNMTRLAVLSRESHPDDFFDVELSHRILDEKQAELNACILSYRRFVITTAVVGCPLDVKFYNTIKQYCLLNDACLLVLMAADPAKIDTPNGVGYVDARLLNENIVLNDVKLNDSLFLSTIKLSAKHIDPVTGMERIGQRGGSFIFASPKQRLKLVANSSEHVPNALMTTGAVTVSSYDTERYMSSRTAYLADHDHVMGAIIVEIESSKAFHYRQIQRNKHGGFTDLGVQYWESGTEPVRAESFVLGDWHSAECDPKVRELLPEMCAALKPKRLFLHDLYDGTAVSHHEANNTILRAKRSAANQLNLEDELRGVANDLRWMVGMVSEVIVVDSNHNDFLSRYLADGRYLKDPQNLYVSLKLAASMLEGKHPLKDGVMRTSGKDSSFLTKVKFLLPDESYTINGVEHGVHGHRGPSGSKGSLIGLERSYGKSVTGHTHSAAILRGAWVVGTSSILDPEYASGSASSWIHCHYVQWPDGTRQLINIISGKWRL